jgi:hypothetical protein
MSNTSPKFILFSFLLLMTFSTCGKGEVRALSVGEKNFINALSKEWRLAKVTWDNVDVTKVFSTLALTVEPDHRFQVHNAIPPIWPTRGEFEIEEGASAGLYNLRRDDGTLIIITELSPSMLALKFYLSDSEDRGSTVTGVYEFLFERGQE